MKSVRTKKTFLPLLAAVCLSLLLSACGSAKENGSQAPSSQTTSSKKISSQTTVSQTVSQYVSDPDVSHAPTEFYLPSENGKVKFNPSVENPPKVDWSKNIDWDDWYSQMWAINVYTVDCGNSTDISLLKGEKIVQLETSGVQTFLLTESGKLFGCGINKYRALGVDSHEPIDHIIQIPLPEQIKKICVGDEGVCAVGVSNDIWFWGRCFEYLSPGNGLDDGYGVIPIRVKFGQPVKELAFRFRKVVLLTEAGEVYVFGEDYNNEMELKPDKRNNGYTVIKGSELVPQKVELPEEIVQVASTMESMFFLGKSGTCYTAFRTSITNYPCHFLKDYPMIRQIDFDQPIKSIGVGDEILYVITQDGEVYGAGNNSSHMMGIGKKEDSDNLDKAYKLYVDDKCWVLKRFEKIPIPEKVCFIGSSRGDCCSYFLTESGNVYATGENYNDCFFTGKNKDKKVTEYAPVKLKLPENIVQFQSKNYLHWFQTADGTVSACGLVCYGSVPGFCVPKSELGTRYITQTPIKSPLTFAENFLLR